MGQGQDSIGEIQNRSGLAGGNIVNPVQVGVKRDVGQCVGHILDEHKVTGLVAIAMDGDGGTSEGGLKKPGDGSSVWAVRILVGPIHIEKT